jgi:hypothetical protein
MIFSSSPRLKSWVAILVVVVNLSLQAQTKTNLDVFKVLVDSSIAEAFAKTTDSPQNIFLNLKLGASYIIFEDQIYQSVKSHGKNITSVFNPSENSELSYSIENAVVNYGEAFREGFLGDHFIERKISLSGSYRIQSIELMANNFYYENVDTIKFDDIQSLENSSYPFTKGEIPGEPFLSNLFEPLVAVTTAAVVIALFFSVRSK